MSELVDILPAFAWLFGAALATYPLAGAVIRTPRPTRRKGPR